MKLHALTAEYSGIVSKRKLILRDALDVQQHCTSSDDSSAHLDDSSDWQLMCMHACLAFEHYILARTQELHFVFL